MCYVGKSNSQNEVVAFLHANYSPSESFPTALGYTYTRTYRVFVSVSPRNYSIKVEKSVQNERNVRCVDQQGFSEK